MSRFFSSKYSRLTPYTPGEQPRNGQFVKLNTNESPFPPSPRAQAAATEVLGRLNLYSDPACTILVQALADTYGVDTDEIICVNGSDDVLNFAFMAFCDEQTPAAFADITYGIYPVFASLNNVPYKLIPLREDLTISVDDYKGLGSTIFIANPNAPTGIPLSRAEIEEIVRANPDNVVIVDEAYVDFGTESCLPLIHRYDNVLIVQTFSKSRSMAGARLGYAMGCKSLINDLNTIRCSINPYNINTMTMAAGVGALSDPDYFTANCQAVMQTRKHTTDRLRSMGFEVTDSTANFVFARTDAIEGGELYQRLKAAGILIRHFDKPRISDYNRITIGSMEQMDILLNKMAEIIKDKE